jgi:predicted nucleic acid-binding protein
MNSCETFIPAFSIDTGFYILNSSMKIDKTISKEAIQKLLKYANFLHSTDESVQRAFTTNFPDFEDALVNSLAENHNMDAILSNNISDFITSTLPVYRPVEFIALFA